MLSFFLAVLAAACNAASNVLQRKADRDEPPELAMSPRLILDLVQRPVWLAGFGTVIVSFLLDGAALSMGQLAAVQPILVLELPMTLIAGSRVFGSRMHKREWAAVSVMTAGLAGLIYFLDPTASSRHGVPVLSWVIAGGVTGAAVVVCVLASSRGGPARRPGLLGLAAGISFGMTAAFMKEATHALHHGPVGVFETWSTYAMAAAGLIAMFLMQNALQAGPLFAAQPGITLADPGVAILWGVLVYGEQTRQGLWLLGAGAAAVALGAGTLLLCRSPLLQESAGSPEDQAPAGEPAS